MVVKAMKMKSPSKLKFKVGDLVEFSEDAGFGEEIDCGIITEIVNRPGGNNKTYKHYGIFWIVEKEHTLEGLKWADETLKLLARGKNERNV